jgi:hypothetical protein
MEGVRIRAALVPGVLLTCGTAAGLKGRTGFIS